MGGKRAEEEEEGERYILKRGERESNDEVDEERGKKNVSEGFFVCVALFPLSSSSVLHHSVSNRTEQKALGPPREERANLARGLSLPKAKRKKEAFSKFSPWRASPRCPWHRRAPCSSPRPGRTARPPRRPAPRGRRRGSSAATTTAGRARATLRQRARAKTTTTKKQRWQRRVDGVDDGDDDDGALGV